MRTISLILAFSAGIIVFISGKRARLSFKKDPKFKKLIEACVLGNEYSELSRIVDKNESKLLKRVKPETLHLLFDRSFIGYQISIRSHLHLRLLSNVDIYKSLPDALGIINLVAREMLIAKNSLLQLAVAHEYSAEEYLKPDKEEWQLIEKTIQNPTWYMMARFDYPLILAAVERISSGEYDCIYNRYNALYSITQGKSLRINCPIYLTLKTHVMMLEKAIEQNDEDDYYVSNLFDLLRTICDHSEYDKTSWKEYDRTYSNLTTFAYLLNEINNDFGRLFNHLVLTCRERDDLGHVAEQLSFIWPFCVLYMAESDNSVSEGFKKEFIKTYFNHILELKNHKNGWGDQLAKDMKDRLRVSNANAFIMFKEVIANLDIGKTYIYNHRPWLLREIEKIESAGRVAPSP